MLLTETQLNQFRLKVTIAFADKLVEVLTSRRKDRLIAKPERKLARDIALWFQKEKKRIIKGLAKELRADFNANSRAVNAGATTEANRKIQEALTKANWFSLLNQLVSGGGPTLENLMSSASKDVLFEGAMAFASDFPGIGVVFQKSDPRAVQYATSHAASRVTRIGGTTRLKLNNLLSDAVDEGLSWTNTAKKIDLMFDDFSGPPLFPSKKFKSRSQAIAAFEIGDAYEAGTEMSAHDIWAAGIELEKRWLSSRDGKVRPAHVANDDRGWIGMKASFPHDNPRPPSDPGCRCTQIFRPLEEGQEVKSDAITLTSEDIKGPAFDKARKAYEDSLSEEELIAVKKWGRSSTRIHRLQKKKRSELHPKELAELKRWEAAVDKAPTYKGDVRRGLHNVDDNTIDSWLASGEVSLNFDQSSTYKGDRIVGFFQDPDSRGNVVLNVEQTKGRALLNMMETPIDEGEIILLSGSNFKVGNVNYFMTKDNYRDFGNQLEFINSDRSFNSDIFFKKKQGFSWPSNPPPGFDIQAAMGSGHFEIDLKEIL